jgi:hypothetical protein
MSVEVSEPKVNEINGIKAGQVKTYTYEKFIIEDSQGRKCRIRASFDGDKFFLRSASLIDESDEITGFKLIPISDIVICNTGKVFTNEINQIGVWHGD